MPGSGRGRTQTLFGTKVSKRSAKLTTDERSAYARFPPIADISGVSRGAYPYEMSPPEARFNPSCGPSPKLLRGREPRTMIGRCHRLTTSHDANGA